MTYRKLKIGMWFTGVLSLASAFGLFVGLWCDNNWLITCHTLNLIFWGYQFSTLAQTTDLDYSDE